MVDEFEEWLDGGELRAAELEAFGDDTAIFRRELAGLRFETWLKLCKHTAAFSFAVADGVINPVAILSNPALEVIYAPTDAESLGGYVDRLTNEARAMKATRLFVIKKCIASTRAGADRPQLVIADSQDDLDYPRLAVYWYAEDATLREQHQGLLFIEGKRITDVGEVGVVDGVFERILHSVSL